MVEDIRKNITIRTFKNNKYFLHVVRKLSIIFTSRHYIVTMIDLKNKETLQWNYRKTLN